jgi:hypothetical protein
MTAFKIWRNVKIEVSVNLLHVLEKAGELF